MTKLAVRALARAMGLQVADKPAAPCLASRIPHHQSVTPVKLSQIERAESALRQLGFEELRVRHHDDIARIELPPADLIRAVSDPLRAKVLNAVRGAGFRFVAVDVAGIQSGAFTLPLIPDHD
jgi:pyridinium-3,5-biscarboxylic acid mononucleotide sulfurtransferase